MFLKVFFCVRNVPLVPLALFGHSSCSILGKMALRTPQGLTKRP